MIKVYGVDDKSDEYKAAIELATIATKSIPDIERNKEILLHIIPSAQILLFGQLGQ